MASFTVSSIQKIDNNIIKSNDDNKNKNGMSISVRSLSQCLCEKKLWLRIRNFLTSKELSIEDRYRSFANDVLKRSFIHLLEESVGGKVCRGPDLVGTTFNGSLRFKVDSIVKNLVESGAIHLVSFRVIDNSKYSKILKSINSGVDEKNVLHSNYHYLYKEVSLLMFLFNFNRHVFLFNSKNNSRLLYVRSKSNNSIAKSILSTFKSVFLMNNIPTLTHDATSMVCKTCEFSDFCHGDEEVYVKRQCTSCKKFFVSDFVDFKCRYFDSTIPRSFICKEDKCDKYEAIF